MRIVESDRIEEAIAEMFVKANYSLPQDMRQAIQTAKKTERSDVARSILSKLCENCDCAESENIPICQDTGMAVVFAKIGQEVSIVGKNFEDAVNCGVRRAYGEGYLRKSVVADPLFSRKNTGDNTPAIIHTRIVCGDKIELTALPKGFGSENMSKIRMFTPSATREDIVSFVCETVKSAGSNPCPPIVVGVGIGGDFEYCAELSKLALSRGINEPNPNASYAGLEKEMLERINGLGIGPQGFGGDTTCLGVNVEYFPTHIAGLPCAVNISCHVTRHAKCVI